MARTNRDTPGRIPFNRALESEKDVAAIPPDAPHNWRRVLLEGELDPPQWQSPGTWRMQQTPITLVCFRCEGDACQEAPDLAGTATQEKESISFERELSAGIPANSMCHQEASTPCNGQPIGEVVDAEAVGPGPLVPLLLGPFAESLFVFLQR